MKTNPKNPPQTQAPAQKEEIVKEETSKEETQAPLSESLAPLINPTDLAKAIKALAELAATLPDPAGLHGEHDLSICYDIRIMAEGREPLRLSNNLTLQHLLHPGGAAEALHNFDSHMDLMLRPLKNYFIQLLQERAIEVLPARPKGLPTPDFNFNG